VHRQKLPGLEINSNVVAALDCLVVGGPAVGVRDGARHFGFSFYCMNKKGEAVSFVFLRIAIEE
jgi:hypothetical protein